MEKDMKEEIMSCQEDIIKAVEGLPYDDAVKALTMAINTVGFKLNGYYVCQVTLSPLVDVLESCKK